MGKVFILLGFAGAMSRIGRPFEVDGSFAKVFT